MKDRKNPYINLGKSFAVMKPSILKKMTVLALIVLVAIVGSLYYALFKIDASSYSIDPYLVPEIAQKTYRHREPVVLVTYGDGHPVFMKNQNGLVQSAVNKGFDVMTTWRKGYMAPEFYEKNKAILDQPRGAGYWLWKPYFILKALKQYPDNAIIVYADSGVVFSKPLTPLFKMLEETPLIFVGNGRPVPLRRHLKKEARNILDIADDDPRLDAEKIWAFFIVMKNTPQVRALMEEWLKMCERKELVTDDPFDPKNQEEIFDSHLHDEAMLSFVVATHLNESKIIPKNVLRKQYGIVNFHRHPEDENLSPLLISAGLPKWLSTLLFNNAIARQIRKQSD